MPLTIDVERVPLETGGDGVVRMRGSRVTLDTIIGVFRCGATAEEIVQQYPSLPLADVYAVIGYYLRHQGDVDTYVVQREDESRRIREQNEARFSSIGIRERLMARRAH